MNADSSNLDLVDAGPGDINAAAEYINSVKNIARLAFGEAALSKPFAVWSESSAPKNDGSTQSKQVELGPALPGPWRASRQKHMTFVAMQSWEGVVVEVDETNVWVRLFDMLKPDNPETETSFSIEELDNEDQDLAVPGAVFYWKLGYLDSPSGRRRQSIIRFRRLPAWTPRSLAAARDEADRLVARFGTFDARAAQR